MEFLRSFLDAISHGSGEFPSCYFAQLRWFSKRPTLFCGIFSYGYF